MKSIEFKLARVRLDPLKVCDRDFIEEARNEFEKLIANIGEYNLYAEVNKQILNWNLKIKSSTLSLILISNLKGLFDCW